MGTFCNYASSVTGDITNTATKVFGSVYACVVESVILTNTSDQTVSIDLNLLRQEDARTITVPLLQKMSLAQNQSMDWMAGKNGMRTMPNDMLFAASDYNDASFSVVVSYLEYKELTAPSPTPPGAS